MAGRTIVIGTGFLGLAVVRALQQAGDPPLHTFRRNPILPGSIRFDLFTETLAAAVALSEIDTLIFTAKVEDAPDSSHLEAAMRSLFHVCRKMRIVYLSSDAVFDGRKGMYVEADSPNPLTLYGRNKKACEDILMDTGNDFCIIRPSYVYGYSCGRLDPRLAQARALLRKGCQFGRFVNMYKSPMEVNQLARIVVRASRSPFQGMLHAGGERMSVHDFFKKSLTSMREDTHRLVPERIPPNAPPEFLADTSLDSRLLADTFGERPVQVQDAFSNFIESRNELQGRFRILASGRATKSP